MQAPSLFLSIGSNKSNSSMIKVQIHSPTWMWIFLYFLPPCERKGVEPYNSQSILLQMKTSNSAQLKYFRKRKIRDYPCFRIIELLFNLGLWIICITKGDKTFSTNFYSSSIFSSSSSFSSLASSSSLSPALASCSCKSRFNLKELLFSMVNYGSTFNLLQLSF